MLSMLEVKIGFGCDFMGKELVDKVIETRCKRDIAKWMGTILLPHNNVEQAIASCSVMKQDRMHVFP